MDRIELLLFSESPITRACVVGGVVVSVTLGSVCIYKRFQRRCPLTPDAPPNTVLLHQPPRGPYAPNLVPFALKLETYLRMAKIPYKVVPGFTKSPKGKVPWLEYNGQVVSDSSFCVNFLNAKLDINLNHHLTASQVGVAKTLQRMVEEHLYWIYVCFPWVLEPERNLIPGLYRLNRLIVWMVQRDLKSRVMVQEIGRHTKGEIIQLMEEDFTALSEILGSNKFIFGDIASEVDCAVFGQLAQFRWNMPAHTASDVLCNKFPSLWRYCDRMKEMYWPDWEDCITHGGTREATK